MYCMYCAVIAINSANNTQHNDRRDIFLNLAYLFFHFFLVMVTRALAERKTKDISALLVSSVVLATDYSRYMWSQLVRCLTGTCYVIIKCNTYYWAFQGSLVSWRDLLDVRLRLGQDGQGEGGRLTGVEGRWYDQVLSRLQRYKLHHLACVHVCLSLCNRFFSEERGWELPAAFLELQCG